MSQTLWTNSVGKSESLWACAQSKQSPCACDANMCMCMWHVCAACEGCDHDYRNGELTHVVAIPWPRLLRHRNCFLGDCVREEVSATSQLLPPKPRNHFSLLFAPQYPSMVPSMEASNSFHHTPTSVYFCGGHFHPHPSQDHLLLGFCPQLLTPLGFHSWFPPPPGLLLTK